MSKGQRSFIWVQCINANDNAKHVFFRFQGQVTLRQIVLNSELPKLYQNTLHIKNKIFIKNQLSRSRDMEDIFFDGVDLRIEHFLHISAFTSILNFIILTQIRFRYFYKKRLSYILDKGDVTLK